MTETIITGRREGTAIFPDNSINWGDLTNAPYQTWSNWNSWKITTGVQIQVQYLDDQGSIANRIPNLRVLNYHGDLTVELDISDTGAFTGEETNIAFVVDAENTFVGGRYYRWTITVDANSDYTVPILFDYYSFYTTNLYVQTLEDVDVLASATTTLATDLGLVRNIQATALRGDPYVEDGYIQTADENDARFQVSVDNIGPTGVTLTSSDDVRNFVSGFSVLDFDNSDSQGDPNVLRISDSFSIEQVGGALQGTNDWTIEMLVRNPADFSDAFLISQQDIENNHPGGTESWVFFINNTLSADSLVFRGGAPGSQYNLNASGPPANSIWQADWNHIAVVRDSSVVSLYVNGTRYDTDTYTETDIQSSPIIIGGVDTDSDGLPDSRDTDTLITGIRISQIARYAGTTYTVPTQVFTNDENTNLLLQNTVTDDAGFEDNGIEYIIEQQGGSPVIAQKNPPKVQVVDYNGNAWDGTIDVVMRGYPKITFDGFGVQPVNIEGA